MKRKLLGTVTVSLLVATSLAGVASVASAAPPTDPWSGTSGGAVVNVNADLSVLTLANVKLATANSTADSTATPRTSSVSQNLPAAVAGIDVEVQETSQTAPPDAGGAKDGVIGASVDPLVPLKLGALATKNEAHWAADDQCVREGVLASTYTETAGIQIAPDLIGLTLLAGDIAKTGVSSVTGTTSLVKNTGLNFGVQSQTVGKVDGLSVLGDAIKVAAAQDTTLTVTHTGDGAVTQTYTPSEVVVTGPDGTAITLEPGASPRIIGVDGVGEAWFSMNNPVVDPTNPNKYDVSLLTIDISLLPLLPGPPLGTVTLDVLPLSASASAPTGGIDCQATPLAITAPAEDATGIAPSAPITGTGEPDATVDVTVDGASIGTAVVAPDGTWSVTPTSPLAAGPIEATATQKVGTTDAGTATVNFTVDAAALAPPAIVAPAADAKVTPSAPISGTSEPGATVDVLIDGASIGTTTADANGDWTLTPTTPLPVGPHEATATATVDGTTSDPSTPVSFDTIEEAPVVVPAPAIVTPANNATDVDPATTIDGTTAEDTTISVIVDGGTAIDVPVNPDGTWSYNPEPNLPAGDHTIDVIATDANGNASDPATIDITIANDEALPAPAIVAPEHRGVTEEPLPTFSGTSEPNATVEVFVDGESIGTATADASGAWSARSGRSLSHGVHDATASQTVADVTSGLSKPITFAVLLHEPAPPVILKPANGLVTSDNVIVASGTGEPASEVRVTLNDGQVLGTTTVAADGTWTLSPVTLADGTYVSVAVERVPQAHVGLGAPPSLDSNVVGFTIDTVAPAVPSIVTPNDGASNVDPSAPISGTTEAGATVDVVIDGKDAGTATADESGAWSLDPTTPLADGGHTIEVIASDAAGNASDPASAVFTVVGADIVPDNGGDPADPGADPALAATGLEASAMSVLLALGLAVLIAGFATLRVRHRNRITEDAS